MAMAAAACKPVSVLPPSLQTQRSHCGALETRQRIKCHYYHRHARSLNISFEVLRHKRENARRVYTRAVPQRDEDKEKCNRYNKCHKCNKEKCNKCHDWNKKDKDEDPKTDEPSWKEKIEMNSHATPESSESVKRDKEEEEEQQSSAVKEKPTRTRGRFHCFARKVGLCETTTSRDEELKKQDLQSDSKQGVFCKLRSWWRCVSRPQNLLAAFLTGLLLYAFALFGWQVMVVAADVTLFVLKCCFVVIVLLSMYIFLI